VIGALVGYITELLPLEVDFRIASSLLVQTVALSAVVRCKRGEHLQKQHAKRKSKDLIPFFDLKTG